MRTLGPVIKTKKPILSKADRRWPQELGIAVTSGLKLLPCLEGILRELEAGQDHRRELIFPIRVIGSFS
jgi:hypothetical protein